MVCKNCGNHIDDDSNFCPFCGSGVISDSKNNEVKKETPDTAAKPRVIASSNTATKSYETKVASENVVLKSKKDNTKSKKVLAFLLIVLAIICVYFAISSSGKSSDKKSSNGRSNNYSQNTTSHATTEQHTSAATTEHYTTATTTEHHTTATTTEQQASSTTEATTTAEVKGASTTIMIYMVASNLESQYGSAGRDIQEIIDAKPASNVNIVVEAGGTTKWQNNFGVFEDGKVVRAKVDSKGVTKLESLGKKCMSEPSELKDFVLYAKKKYPAERYILIMWDHGGGVPVSFGHDENYLSNGLMTSLEMGTALMESGVHFQTIIFDACLMANLENAICMQPSADYMVASEESMPACGTYYTDWINKIGSLEASDVSYLKKICDDYLYDTKVKKDLKSITISCIRLDKVLDVYYAYVDYIKEAYNDAIVNKNYVDFLQARIHCNYFENSDSVDIKSFAVRYPNGQSNKLISAINDASYYKSKNDFFSGLTVYMPSKYGVFIYSEGREMLAELQYDPIILEFYDATASILYAGNKNLDATGQNWYNKDYASYLKVPSINQEDLALTQNSDGKWIINMPSELSAILDYCSCTVTFKATTKEDEEVKTVLGSDVVSYESYDSKGNVLAKLPNWLHDKKSDNPVMFYTIVYYYDQNSFYQLGLIPALVNDHEAWILYYMDNDHPDGYAMGYCYCDGFDVEGYTPSNMMDYCIDFNDNDTIDFVYFYENNGQAIWVSWDKPQKASGLSLEYKMLEKDEDEGQNQQSISDAMIWIQITAYDVFGNSYDADVFGY